MPLILKGLCSGHVRDMFGVVVPPAEEGQNPGKKKHSSIDRILTKMISVFVIKKGSSFDEPFIIQQNITK